MEKINLKKAFLMVMIISLISSALVGIVIFLVWELGDVELKILWTAITLAVYSILGLCCLLPYERNRNRILWIIGMILCLLWAIYSIYFVWGFDFFGTSESSARMFATSLIVPFTMAHISLLSLIDYSKSLLKTVSILTIWCVSIVAFLLLILVWAELDDALEGFIRLIGVSVILDVLWTIVLPILNKMNTVKKID